MNVATLEATTSWEETLDIHDTARRAGRAWALGRHNSHSANDYDKGGTPPVKQSGKQIRIKAWMKLGNYSSEKNPKSTCKT